jgi:hypothetical protein
MIRSNRARGARAPAFTLLVAAAALAGSMAVGAQDDDGDRADGTPVFTCASAGAGTPLPMLRKLHEPVFPGTVRRQAYKYRKPGHPSPTWPVTTSFEIDADGRTRNISSTTTDPASFGQHANNAVSRWRFDPASAGAAVAATGCTYEFTFEFADNVGGNRSR